MNKCAETGIYDNNKIAVIMFTFSNRNDNVIIINNVTQKGTFQYRYVFGQRSVRQITKSGEQITVGEFKDELPQFSPFLEGYAVAGNKLCKLTKSSTHEEITAALTSSMTLKVATAEVLDNCLKYGVPLKDELNFGVVHVGWSGSAYVLTEMLSLVPLRTLNPEMLSVSISVTEGKFKVVDVLYAPIVNKNTLDNAISGMATYSQISEMIDAKVAPLEAKIEDLSKTNIEPLPADSITATPVNDETKDFVVTGTIAVEKVYITGKSVALNEVKIADDNRMMLNAVKEVSSKGMQISGAYTKEKGNTIVSVKESEYVTFKDLVIDATTYNAIEIGLSSDKLPKYVTFENCHFAGKFDNNAILVFGTQNNAVINLVNCTFDDVSNGLRISNNKNVHVTVNITNCVCKKWESRENMKQFAGMVICEDYTSGKGKEAENNLFAPDKVTINFINFIGPDGKKLVKPKDMSTILGTGEFSQLLYVYYDVAGFQAYDAAKYPTVNIL